MMEEEREHFGEKLTAIQGETRTISDVCVPGSQACDA